MGLGASVSVKYTSFSVLYIFVDTLF